MCQQWTQYIPKNSKKCVRCGYCCKKATCHIGLTHGASPKNCEFLIGKKPGEYKCWLAEKKVYDEILIDLAIGQGCCEPLNTDRNKALLNLGVSNEIQVEHKGSKKTSK